MGLIYKITNQLNNKSYIGLTTRDFGTRKKEYFYYNAIQKFETPIYLAFNKYGISNFTFELIEDNISNKDLDCKEQEYIEKFQTKVPYGYNATIGGRVEGTKQMGRTNAKPVYRIDQYTFEVLEWAPSASEMARRLETTTIGITRVCNRQAFTSKGYIFRWADDYSKAEVEEFHSTKRLDIHIPVECYYLYRGGIIGQYPSIYQASKETGISQGAIYEYCKGERDRAGLIDEQEIGFRYLNDPDGNAVAERNRKVRKYKTRDIYDEPVVLFNKRTGEVYKEYDSIIDATKDGWGMKGKIKDLVLGNKLTAFIKDGDEYTWRLVD